MTPLDGKTAIVTGAAGGIGRASAESLARRGVKVVLADINGPAAEAAAAAIVAEGGQAISFQADLTQDGVIEALDAATAARFGEADIVMNNAGVIVRGAPEDLPFSEWQRVIDINLMSVVRSIQFYIPKMIARRSGHIVNTASAAGLFPYAFDRLPYAATKAALVTLSEGLAIYLEPHGVGVTCLCPGPVKTDFSAGVKNWTPGLIPRGPGAQFEMKQPAEVGEMVADAIEANRFFLPTDEGLRTKMQARAADPDAFLAKRIAEIAAG